MTEQYLRDIYYDSDAAYAGISTLWRKIKDDKIDIKYSELKEWLKEQETYTLHKPTRKKYPTDHHVHDQFPAPD